MVLNWETASEYNTDYFEILKSTDGRNYHSSGTVAAIGNNQRPLNVYTFKVTQAERYMYYKLKMMDKDGLFSYSPSVYQKNTCAGDEALDLTVFPNPTTSQLTLLFNDVVNEEIVVTLINLFGEKIVEMNYTGSTGTILSDLNSLPSGRYLMMVKTGRKVFIKKIEKI